MTVIRTATRSQVETMDYGEALRHAREVLRKTTGDARRHVRAGLKALGYEPNDSSQAELAPIVAFAFSGDEEAMAEFGTDYQGVQNYVHQLQDKTFRWSEPVYPDYPDGPRRDEKRELILAHVARTTDLTLEEKSLWFLVWSYHREHGGGFLDLERVGEHLGRTPNTVRKYRKSLSEKRYLRRLQTRVGGPQWFAVVPATVMDEIEEAAG